MTMITAAGASDVLPLMMMMLESIHNDHRDAATITASES
jgi:hypothetical protein